MVADSDCSKRWLPFGALLEATKKVDGIPY